MHTYKFYWLDGKYSIAKGRNPVQAFNIATIKNPHRIADILKYEEI